MTGETIMVPLLDVLPILALALIITGLPLLSDGPPDRRTKP
jgi:hypothetical protein